GRLFTSRWFELADEEGNTFGYARSIWAAIDMQSRRPTLLDIEALSPYIDPRPCPIEKPGKIQPVETQSVGIPYTITYSDLDINGHFNSVKYIEHLLDLFDIEQFMTQEIGRMEIAYMAEGKPGMPLTLHKQEIAPGHSGLAICSEGKALCRAAVTWR
ncbi:MAG: thioesterase, partial [bacterium]|nr:thioesterase [bacterium]